MKLNIVKDILFSFGYKNLHDFLDTTFLIKKGIMMNIILFSLSISPIALLVEKYIGLQPIAYLGFVILFILEFVTGVSASVFIRKEKFESFKMGRIVLKIFVYSIILGLLNVFKKYVGGYVILGFDFNFFEWTYFLIINILILQLIISVLENCEALGFKEVGIILRIFRRKVKDIEEEIDNNKNDLDIK